VLVVLLALVGCPGRHAPLPPPPPPPPPPAPRPTKIDIPVRDFLVKGTPMSINNYHYGTFGYVLLHRNDRRSMSFCTTFINGLDSLGDLPNDTDPSTVDIMVTYWPLTATPTNGEPWDCKWLVAHYDYGRAAMLRARANMNGRPGPVLVMWKTRLRNPGDEQVTFDLTRVAPSGFPDAVTAWSGLSGVTGTSWFRAHWTQAILGFRTLLDDYSCTLLAARAMSAEGKLEKWSGCAGA